MLLSLSLSLLRTHTSPLDQRGTVPRAHQNIMARMPPRAGHWGSQCHSSRGDLLTVPHFRESRRWKGPCLSHRIQSPHFTAAETVLERLRDLTKVTELGSGRAGTRTHAHTLTLTRSRADEFQKRWVRPWPGSPIMVHPAGHSGYLFCK